MKRPLIIIFLFCLFSYTLHAQYVIKITNNRNNKEIIIKEGERVAFITKAFVKTGYIRKISESTVIIKNIEYKLSDFKKIGKRKKGTTGISLSIGLIGATALSLNSLTDEPAYNIPRIVIGVGLVGTMEYIELSNRIYKINKRRTLSIENAG